MTVPPIAIYLGIIFESEVEPGEMRSSWGFFWILWVGLFLAGAIWMIVGYHATAAETRQAALFGPLSLAVVLGFPASLAGLVAGFPFGIFVARVTSSEWAALLPYCAVVLSGTLQWRLAQRWTAKK